MKLSDDLVQLTARLMLVQERKEAIKLAQELATFAEKIDDLECGATISSKQKSITAELKFTMKEISMSRMSKSFKKEFIANGLVAHIVKRPSGKRGFYYEIQYRRNGYYITASSKNLAEAKKKFLEKTEPGEIEKYQKKAERAVRENTFEGVSEEWFTYKKTKLCERTYLNYRSYYDRFLFPPLHGQAIINIKTIDLDKIFSELSGRLYEDTRIVANSIFKYANLCGLIPRNPATLIPFKKVERQNRRNLTNKEVRFLLIALESKEYIEYKQPILIMLYFGFRPCELPTVHREGDFLVGRNAKRKNGKIEYKKIPISDRIKGKLDFSKSFAPSVNTQTLNRIFKKIFSDKGITQYSLRHTFATKCQEYVRPDIVDIWMGDSPERLVGKVYTHFSDEFMKEQMDKVLFDF